jgi:hypothetical protein
MFYESAYKENPNSKMAEEWMLKHGLIAEDKLDEIAKKYEVSTRKVRDLTEQTRDIIQEPIPSQKKSRRNKNQLVERDEDKEALDLAATTLTIPDVALAGDDEALDGDEALAGDDDDDEDEEEQIPEKKTKKEYTPNEAMFEYYKLKQKWIKQLYNISHQKGKSIKTKCVNCGREGGTYFSTNNRVLVAYCTSIPACKLNIEIHKGDGKIVLLRDLEYDLHNKINEYKKNIITIKLNLLFGYETEENTIELFKQNNKLLVEHERLLYECHNYLLQITEDRAELYKEYKETLENELREIKLINELYIQTKDPQNIQEIIKKYVDTVYPLVEKIRNVKYSQEYILKEETKKNVFSTSLVQDEFNIQENEMYIGDEIKVVKFIV